MVSSTSRPSLAFAAFAAAAVPVFLVSNNAVAGGGGISPEVGAEAALGAAVSFSGTAVAVLPVVPEAKLPLLWRLVPAGRVLLSVRTVVVVVVVADADRGPASVVVIMVAGGGGRKEQAGKQEDHY